MGAKNVHQDSFYYCDGEFNRDLPPQHVKSVKWVRIKNLHKHPKYFVNDLCVCDLVQGEIGNCYFVSAIHSLILYYTNTNRKMLYKFLKQIKPWQRFDDSLYTGKFSVSLWNSFGYQEVQVDDYIPVNAYTNKPCYTSNRHGEYWVSILEKAVAKFTNSSYKDYDLGGETTKIFRLFIPRGIRSLLLAPSAEELGSHLARESIATAALFKETTSTRREGGWREIIDADSNIALKHAYCVHALDKETVLVINPWYQVEWSKSVSTVNERSVSQNVCRMCNVEHKEDGRWVMRAEDLVKIFDTFFVYSFPSSYSQLAVGNSRIVLHGFDLSKCKAIVLTIILLDDDLTNTVIKIYVNDDNNNNKRISQYESLTTCITNTLYISAATTQVLNVSIVLSINKNFQAFSTIIK